MAVSEMFNSFNGFLRFFALVLLFWLCSLVIKWLLTLVFGEKGSRIVGIVGYALNFTLKRFTLSKIFKIDVIKTDVFTLTFEHEKTDRWDILFTSLVIVPLSIGLLFGVGLGSLGLYFLDQEMDLVAIMFFSFGFIIAINSSPSYRDVLELKDCSVRSIFVWLLFAFILSGIIGAPLFPLMGFSGIVLGALLGLLLTATVTFFIPTISDWISNDGSSVLDEVIEID